ncbi:MAG: nuclear transport factor 2 family protein, partial [Acidobacteriaceae bacterium]
PAAIGQIKELLRKYEVSIDNIDLNLANQIWSHAPEVILIEPRGTERGLSAIEKKFYEQTMGSTFSQRKLLIESPAIHVYGDTAWGEFTWTFHGTTRDGGKQMTTQGRESQVYHKENGRWHIVCDHYSGLPVTGARKGF